MRRNYKRCVTIHYFSTHLSSLTMLRSNTSPRSVFLALGKGGCFIESCKSGVRPKHFSFARSAHETHTGQCGHSDSHTVSLRAHSGVCDLCDVWVWVCTYELSLLLDLPIQIPIKFLKPYYVVLNMPCTPPIAWSHFHVACAARCAARSRVRCVYRAETRESIHR